MKNLDACLGPETKLEIDHIPGGIRASLWARADDKTMVQWSIETGLDVTQALNALDKRLQGLTYDDVMRT